MCAPGDSPYDPTSACNCPKCIPPNCTACPSAASVACTSGTLPSTCNNCTSLACCARCIPPQCPPCATSTAMTVCPGGVQPVGAATTASCATCPTCRPDCSTAAAFTGCAAALSVAPFCDGTNAGVGCCPGCRPPPPCTLADIAKCVAASSLTGIVTCTTEAPRLNFSTCCLNCKPPAPPVPCAAGLSTAAIVRTIRPCAVGEPAITLPGQCVKTCRQPGSECDPATIQDWSSIQVCPAGVASQWIGCVPTCIPPAPVCTSPCASGTICVRDAIVGAACVPQTLCFPLHAKGIDPTADPSNVLRLIVQKHCEDVTAGGVACDVLMKRILDSVKCTRNSPPTTTTDPKTGTVYEDIQCCIAIDPATNTAGRRLLSSSDTFQGATQNPGATGGTSFYTASTDSSSATVASALLGLPLLAVFL